MGRLVPLIAVCVDCQQEKRIRARGRCYPCDCAWLATQPTKPRQVWHVQHDANDRALGAWTHAADPDLVAHFDTVPIPRLVGKRVWARAQALTQESKE